jgi:hypothetical protein
MKVCYSAEPFIAKGLRAREFFPHQVIALRKAYPDTFLQFARRSVETTNIAAGTFWQINLYSSRIDDLPEEVFRDTTINWHRQQFGLLGLVAAGGLFIDGRDAYVSLLQSDLCQQIFRHPQLKRTCGSRINNRFRYWYKLLFNAILDFALAHDIEHVFSPTAEQITRTTRKKIDDALFRQIYDYPLTFYTSRRTDVGPAEYWEIPISENAERIVQLEPRIAARPETPPSSIICVYHDIEENVDTDVSPESCGRALLRMLEIERQQDTNVTYNILGNIFQRVAPLVASAGEHSITFHSYNHQIDDLQQLARVREVDLQVKGYRPPRSVITPELSDYSLVYYNFEWLMSSASSLGFDLPRLENGIVKIPALVDDYSIATGAETYQHWFDRIMETVRHKSFVAIGLHDCYSQCWLDNYFDLLESLKSSGKLWTCDQVLNHTYLNEAFSDLH